MEGSVLLTHRETYTVHSSTFKYILEGSVLLTHHETYTVHSSTFKYILEGSVLLTHRETSTGSNKKLKTTNMIEASDVKIELDDTNDYSSAIEDSLTEEGGWNFNHQGKHYFF